MTPSRNIAAILLASILVAASTAAHAALVFSTSTDKQQYVVGETLNVLVKAQNTGDQPVTLNFSSGYQADYLMDSIDLWSSHHGFIQALTFKTIPANGSYTWVLPHLWKYYSPEPGTHSVIGRVVGNDYTSPAQFLILPAPALSEPVAPLPEPAGVTAILTLTLVFSRRRRS